MDAEKSSRKKGGAEGMLSFCRRLIVTINKRVDLFLSYRDDIRCYFRKFRIGNVFG